MEDPELTEPRAGPATQPTGALPVALPVPLAARFSVLRLLGSGGGGTVLLVRDQLLGRVVAVKLLRRAAADALSAFTREAALLASVEHPNIVRLYDGGVAEEVPYLVMEFVPGKTLFQRLVQGRPTQIEGLRILRDVVAGLAAAHRVGIVHRDLKPANVFLDETHGAAKLADFGLATRRDPGPASAPGGEAWTIDGTPGYMAPEQGRGEVVGLAADVYAFGVVSHEVLTGRKLFAGRSPHVVIRAQQDAAIQPPSRLNPAVPRRLDELVMACLSANPAARPPVEHIVEELARQVEQLVRGRRVSGTVAYPQEPYKLLQYCDREDASLFQGRDGEIADLLNLLDADVRLVTVFGPCGIGKSSLLRAGLLPALDPARFDPLVLTSGPDPFTAIWTELCTRAEFEGAPDVRRLPELVLQYQRKSDRTLLLVLDQMEEVFTQNRRGAAEIETILLALQALAEDHRLELKVILSLRVEFLGELYGLTERLGFLQGSFALGEMGVESLAAAIAAPALTGAYGFRFEDGFPGALAADILRVTHASGDTSLPVMQIVCSQLVSRMRASGGNTIGSALYEGKWGGADGALQRYVEERLAGLEYARAGGLARRMLKALTIREGTGSRYAREQDEEELVGFVDRAGARRTLEMLLKDHLVVRVMAGADKRIRLASEVVCQLIDAWELEPDDGERAARILTARFRQWVEHGRLAEDLLAGAALGLVSIQLPQLRQITDAERAYLQASAKQAARRYVARAGLALGVVLCLTGALYAAYGRPGRVRIDSQPPGAVVACGPEVLGVTPLTWEGRPGVQHLTLNKAKHLPTDLTIQIPSGGEAHYEPVLSYPFGILALTTTPPDATCELSRVADGPRNAERRFGKPMRTPFTQELPSGHYHVRITLDGYATMELKDVELGSNRQILNRALTLEANCGWLSLACEAKGTSVVVMDAKTGAVVHRTGLPLLSPMRIEPGRYRVESFNLDYMEDHRIVEVARNRQTDVTLWTPRLLTLSGPRSGGALAAPPLLAYLDGDEWRDVIRVDTAGGIRAESGKSGTLLWHYRGPKPLDGTPLLADVNRDGVVDVCFSTVDGHLRILNGSNGVSLHEYPVAAKTHPAAMELKGISYLVVGGEGQLSAIHARTGAPLWKRPMTGLSVEPVVVPGGGPLVLIAAGGLQALAGETGATVARVPTNGSVVAAPAIADLQGDGRLQAIVLTDTDHAMAVDLPGGRVRWDKSVAHIEAASPDVGDVDGDGVADIVLLTTDHAVAALSGVDGNVMVRCPPYPEPITPPVLADLDRDGTMEIVVGTGPGTVEALSGRHRYRLWTQSVAGLCPAGLTVADLDRDGTPDAVGGTTAGNFLAVLGPGPQADWVSRTTDEIRRSVAVGDLNGDRVPDVAVLSDDGNLAAVSGADGTVLWSLTDRRFYCGPAIGDVDADGVPDLVLGHRQEAIVALSGKTRAPLWTASCPSGSDSPPILFDLDRDGTLDVAAPADHGVVRAFSGKDGHLLWSRSCGKSRTRLVAGAFGATAVGVVSEEGPVLLLEGATGAVRWRIDGPGGRSTPRAADLDGDGVPDLVYGAADGSNWALSGKDGHTLWKHMGGAYPRFAPGVGDLNGDGRPDVITRREDGRVLALDGRTGVPFWTRDAPGAVGTSCTLADLDGDRLPEVIVKGVNDRWLVLSGRTGNCLLGIDGGPGIVSPPAVVEISGRERAFLGAAFSHIIARTTVRFPLLPPDPRAIITAHTRRVAPPPAL